MQIISTRIAIGTSVLAASIACGGSAITAPAPPTAPTLNDFSADMRLFKDVLAVQAVFSAGLTAGARRSQFAAAGLINP